MRGNVALVVLAAIAVVFLLYWGEPFFVPFFISLFISYALTPVVNALTLVVRLRAVAAAIVVAALVGLIAAAVYAWSDDVQALWEKIPVATKSISKSLQQLSARPSAPLAEVKKAAAQIESLAQTGKAAPPPVATPTPQPTPIPVWQLLWTGWKSAVVVGSQLMVVLFLVFFMLASGDLFKRKLVGLAASGQKQFTLQVMDEIDSQIRNYLVVVLISNVLVGLGTWLVFWMLGMQYPGLWGVVAGIVHTAPYVGPALIAGGSLVVAFVQFDEWPKAFLVSGASIVVATLVGSVFATWLASRQTRMNTAAAFTGLLFFGWIWGIWGILLGIPILAMVKTVCDHNEDWKPVAELLGR